MIGDGGQKGGAIDERGQASLLALVAALAALAAATGLAVVVADAALAGVDRDPGERRAAAAAAGRFVAADSPLTRRANVLDGDALGTVTAANLSGLAPPLSGRPVRVRVGGRTVVERGDPRGATVRRIALLAEDDTRRRAVNLSASRSVVLPRRADRVRIDPNGTGVETVRASGQVVLHDPDGIGAATVDLPLSSTVELSFAGGEGTVRLTIRPERTRKTAVEVTVGDRE